MHLTEPDARYQSRRQIFIGIMIGYRAGTCHVFLEQEQFQSSANHTGFTGRFERVSGTAVCTFRERVFRLSLGVHRRCEEQD